MTRNQIAYAEHVREVRKDAETRRSNLAKEAQAKNELLETTRSHKANETIAYANLDELSRHNRASEALGFSQLAEAARHNKASEAIGQSQVGLGYAQVQLGYSTLSETNRANVAKEYQNRLTHDENVRTNKANEYWRGESVLLDNRELQEKTRHNKEFEEHLTWGKINETVSLVPQFIGAASKGAGAIFGFLK